MRPGRLQKANVPFNAKRRILVYKGKGCFPMSAGIEGMPLPLQ